MVSCEFCRTYSVKHLWTTASLNKYWKFIKKATLGLPFVAGLLSWHRKWLIKSACFTFPLFFTRNSVTASKLIISHGSFSLLSIFTKHFNTYYHVLNAKEGFIWNKKYQTLSGLMLPHLLKSSSLVSIIQLPKW